MKNKFYSVYLIECKPYFYIGVTQNVKKRYKEHLSPYNGKVAMRLLKQKGYRNWELKVLKNNIPTMKEAYNWEDYFQINFPSVYQMSLIIDNNYFKQHFHNNPEFITPIEFLRRNRF